MPPEKEDLSALAKKLSTPRRFTFDKENKYKFSSHQFLHLHHMKTGGTSMEYYIACARERLRTDKGYSIPHDSIHECNKRMYEWCKSGRDRRCYQSVADSALISFCAPLKDLPDFSWGSVENGIGVATPPSHGAITVLRDPVERVWSMYRFKTKDCFKCKPLLEIYDMMDSGELSELEPTCYQQLQNHQVANLLSSEFLHAFNGENNATDTTDDDEMVEEAVENMKSFFTVIGLTERLEETIDIAESVFPWMQRTVDWSDRECALQHANKSPRNNRCGPNKTHWDLPSTPDAETRAAIEKHNQLDRKLYAAAVEHFELQLRAMEFDGESTR